MNDKMNEETGQVSDLIISFCLSRLQAYIIQPFNVLQTIFAITIGGFRKLCDWLKKGNISYNIYLYQKILPIKYLIPMNEEH